MSGEPKDPAIKLFGKTIPLPEIPPESAGPDSNGIQETSSLLDEDISGGKEEQEDDKETLEGDTTTSKQEDGAQSLLSLEDSTNPDAASGTSENFKTASVDKDTSSAKKTSKSEEEQSETSNSQDKPLKKPDKILPCPRCNSMDTKFCYYNNYNVNQPRHFCKNCQRYWTAGGTMRNVPVGAGRRKNKSSASHYRHLTVSETLQNVRIDVPNGVNHHPSPGKSNGTVLAFGSDSPLCESMASVLNLAEKTMRNGFHKPEGLMVRVPCGDGDRGTNHVNGSSSSHEGLEGKNGPPEFATAQNCTAFPPQIQCYPGAPWPYLPMSPPPFCPPGYAMPMPIYPAYWSCGVPGAWNIPWMPGPSSPSQTGSSGPNSPTLGKHSRDEHVLKSSSSGQDEAVKEANAEKCLWFPKTLRIDDPGEAAKSSIWATLGIKKDSPDSVRGGGLFKAFQSKGEERNHVADGSPVLQANPAALSRSLNFNESS